MVTLKQVAAAAGVSTFTVSRVMSGRGRESRISEDRILEVEKAAVKLGYRPNSAARATRERRTRQIGVLTFTHVDAPEFVPQNQLLIQGINRELEKFGYVTSLIRLNDLWDSGKIKHRAFAEQLVDGIAAINMLPAALEAELGSHFEHCVWIDANVFGDGRCLRRDEKLAGRLVVEHAARVGYQRILYIDDVDASDLEPLYGSKHYSWVERGEGIREAAAELGIPLEAIPCGYHWDPALATLGQRFESDCLVVGYGVEQTRMALRMAMEAGRLVGRDFGLACCEGTPDFRADWPGLCHSEFDRLGMGEQAARMLIEQINVKLDGSSTSGRSKGSKVPLKARTPQKQVPRLIEGDTAPGPRSPTTARNLKPPKWKAQAGRKRTPSA
jgi:DNA-binding LacI/PurR family transcriptional regulator